jgi:hypothetical protein
MEHGAPRTLEMCLKYKESRAFKSGELNTVPLDASGKCFVHL